MNKNNVACMGIGSITLLVAIALFKDINGVIFSSGAGIIGFFVGLVFDVNIFDKFKKKRGNNNIRRNDGLN